MHTSSILSALLFASVSVSLSAMAEEPNPFPNQEQINKAQADTKRRVADAAAAYQATKDNPAAKPGINYDSAPFSMTQLTSQYDVKEAVKQWKTLIGQSKIMQKRAKIKLFVSFSMPESSITRYVQEASIIGRDHIVIVLQGMIDGKDLNETARKIHSLTNGKNVEFQIDPTAFDRFNIRQVPAMVVFEDDPNKIQSCIQRGENPDNVIEAHSGVYGDVSIQYGLEYLARNIRNNFLKDGIDHFLAAFRKE